MIAGDDALDAFGQRYVDGGPVLGPAAREALDAGEVLIGGTVSSGCDPAEGARLAVTVTVTEVRLIPIGLPPDDPNVECVGAITSIALMAIDVGKLPAGVRIGGT